MFTGAFQGLTRNENDKESKERLTWPWPADPFITLTIDQPASMSGAVVALELDG